MGGYDDFDKPTKKAKARAKDLLKLVVAELVQLDLKFTVPVWEYAGVDEDGDPTEKLTKAHVTVKDGMVRVDRDMGAALPNAPVPILMLMMPDKPWRGTGFEPPNREAALDWPVQDDASDGIYEFIVYDDGDEANKLARVVSSALASGDFDVSSEAEILNDFARQISGKVDDFFVPPDVKELVEHFGEIWAHDVGDPDRAALSLVLQWCTADSAREIMERANSSLKGHGVEALIVPGDYDAVAEYVNMGDPYVPTLVHELQSDRFVLTDWGSWLEEYERENDIDTNEDELADRREAYGEDEGEG